MKTLIQNGTVYTNGQLVKTDVLIDDGQIQALGDLGDLGDEVGRVINASGKLVVPGLVDVHVHYRDPGQTQKETIT